MQTRQGNMLQSLESVQAFFKENAGKLAGVVNTGTMQRLADAIADLAAHVTTQSGSTIAERSATTRVRVLRQALIRDHMGHIAQIAASDSPTTAGIEELHLPKQRLAVRRLAAAAQGMAQQAAPHAAVFVAAGLPQDFIARLNDATDAMLAAVEARLQSRGKRKSGTKGLTEQLAAGRKIVRVLDRFVVTALQDDPGLLAHWKLVKRVRKTASHSPAVSTPTSTSSTTTPTPVTVPPVAV
jgi:hypothetical protein